MINRSIKTRKDTPEMLLRRKLDNQYLLSLHPLTITFTGFFGCIVALI